SAAPCSSTTSSASETSRAVVSATCYCIARRSRPSQVCGHWERCVEHAPLSLAWAVQRCPKPQLGSRQLASRPLGSRIGLVDLAYQTEEIMTMSTDEKELESLAANLVQRATVAGAEIAEAQARAGWELSVKVRLGETELVQEAGHKSVYLRAIRAQRVALTST